MRRRQNATIQLNLRVTPQLFRELEARAKAHEITVSEEVRQTIEKADRSLASFLADFERQVCDAVEQRARGSSDPEPTFQRLATFGAEIRSFYTKLEQTLLPDMTDPKVRELMRGGR
jgi:hypothetical protein